MATSLLVPRLCAGLVLAMWAALAATVAAGYRTGAPLDPLVASTLLFPCIVAAAAIAWSPGSLETAVGRAGAALGIGTSLVVAPLVIDAVRSVAAGVPLPVAPSAEAAYAGVSAFFATCVLACLGPVWRRWTDAGRPVRISAVAAIASTLTILGGLAFGGAIVTTERWLSDHPAPTSAWGPTGGGLSLPPCTQWPTLGAGARLEVDATATIDSEVVGTATIRGLRSGLDESWTGRLRSTFGRGDLEYARVGTSATLGRDGGRPSPVAPGLAVVGPGGLTVDGPMATLATRADGATAVEDLGIELIDGAPARHCRVAVDGDSVLASVPVLRWLGGQAVDRPSTALNIWRGQLDRWTFADGQLGRAVVRIGGYPGAAWDSSGILAWLEAEVRALDRSKPHRVVPAPP